MKYFCTYPFSLLHLAECHPEAALSICCLCLGEMKPELVSASIQAHFTSPTTLYTRLKVIQIHKPEKKYDDIFHSFTGHSSREEDCCSKGLEIQILDSGVKFEMAVGNIPGL